MSARLASILAYFATIVFCSCSGERGNSTAQTQSQNVDDRFKLGITAGTSKATLLSRLSARTLELRGANYVRLKPSSGILWHSTFGVGDYDAAHAQKALSELAGNRYNIVRVFVDVTSASGIASGLSAPGLNSTYLSNLFDFLRRAQNLGVGVVITSQWAPKNYADSLAAKTNNVPGANGLYLNPQLLQANIQFYGDLAAAIHKAALDSAVFAFDLHNEGEFAGGAFPLSENQGKFTAPNGKTYSLASSSERQAMLDDAVVNWIDGAGSAIAKNMPNVLITQSLFSPFLVRNTGRIPFRLSAVERSQADYLDAHVYAQSVSDIDTEIAELRVKDLTKNKPIIAGEMGALSQKTIAEGAVLVRGTYAKTCRSGFVGWLFWTWDTDEQTDWRNLLMNSGAMNGVFSPVANQLSCSYVSSAAPAAPATASTPQANSCRVAEGFFKIDTAIFYSNGVDSFCVYGSWADYKAAGGSDNTSSIPARSLKPTCMRDDGRCVVNVRPAIPTAPATASTPQANSCRVAEGFFKTDTAIFYSNGVDSFCVYGSWADYKAAGGSDNTSSIPSRSLKPTCMRDDGRCIVNR